MQRVNVIFVPVPMPVGNGVGWEKRAKPHPYPRHVAGQLVAARGDPRARPSRGADADRRRQTHRRRRRASKLLRELNGG